MSTAMVHRVWLMVLSVLAVTMLFRAFTEDQPSVPSSGPVASNVPATVTISTPPKPKDPNAPPQDYYLDGFDGMKGRWLGKNLMVVGNGHLKIDDEVDCRLEGDRQHPTESYNSMDPKDGVWWVGHCGGTRFAPGPVSVVRITAYWRWPAVYTKHDFYVVIGDFQYGPFQPIYTDTH